MYGPSTWTELTVILGAGSGGVLGLADEGDSSCAHKTLAGMRKSRMRSFRAMRQGSATDCPIFAGIQVAQALGS
jgi:hypothetical protein